MTIRGAEDRGQSQLPQACTDDDSLHSMSLMWCRLTGEWSPHGQQSSAAGNPTGWVSPGDSDEDDHLFGDVLASQDEVCTI